MGCLQSSEKEKDDAPADTRLVDPPPKTVDPRLPFDTYRQLFNLKNSWKAVSRKLEETAKENLVLFFRAHPEHKALHKILAPMEDEEKMLNSTPFEEAALAIFNVFDEFMEAIEKAIDMGIDCLIRAGKAHSKIEGFQADYFKDMEGSFLGAVRLTLGDRFSEATEENFRKLFRFVIGYMTEGLTGVNPNIDADGNRI